MNPTGFATQRMADLPLKLGNGTESDCPMRLEPLNQRSASVPVATWLLPRNSCWMRYITHVHASQAFPVDKNVLKPLHTVMKAEETSQPLEMTDFGNTRASKRLL